MEPVHIGSVAGGLSGFRFVLVEYRAVRIQDEANRIAFDEREDASVHKRLMEYGIDIIRS